MNELPEKPATQHITREQLAAMFEPAAAPTADEIAALDRLMVIASSDTGQSRRCADFLLSWWNAGSCGGFDMTDLWAVDTEIARDMVTVFGLVARVHSYPDSGPFAYGGAFKALVGQWRDFGEAAAQEKAAKLAEAARDNGRLDFSAELVTYGSAPGYRDASLVFNLHHIGDGENPSFQADIRLRPQDGEAIVRHILDVHRLAWGRTSGNPPIDVEPGETRPRWIDRI